jgi:hypothetical protein
LGNKTSPFCDIFTLKKYLNKKRVKLVKPSGQNVVSYDGAGGLTVTAVGNGLTETKIIDPTYTTFGIRANPKEVLFEPSRGVVKRREFAFDDNTLKHYREIKPVGWEQKMDMKKKLKGGPKK